MNLEKKKTKYLSEKLAAQRVRQNKINNWLKNEELYNGVQQPTLMTKSNLHIPKVFEGVNLVSSRVGKVPEINYDTKPEGDENAADLMKSNWQYDMKRHRLEYYAKLSKTETGLYGRGIFKFIPDNASPRYELIDTLAFLINPTASDTRKTLIYAGVDFIYKTPDQLDAEADKMDYDKTVLKKVKKFASDKAQGASQEQSNMSARLNSLGFSNTTELGTKMLRGTEWYTKIDGDWMLQFWIEDQFLLREVPLTELGLDKPPFFSFATFPRAVTFWVPSIADVLRDPNLAMDVNLNQVIDNNTYRNFGMMFALSSSGLPNSITPSPLKVTKVTSPTNKISDAVLPWSPPELTNALNVHQLVNAIAESASGMSSQSGAPKGKRSVSELAKEMAAIQALSDTMKDSFMMCFEEMAQNYADFVSKHLTEPRNVKVFGQKPITVEGVTKKNFQSPDGKTTI